MYLMVMSLATAFCWTAFLSICLTVNPEVTNWVGFALFYASLGLSLLGTIALLGFFVRFIVLKRALAFRAVKEAFRQSFLFSFFVLSVLFFLSKDLFNWINLAVLVIGLSVFEFFLLSYNRPPAIKNNY
jgi:hypothetical protein